MRTKTNLIPVGLFVFAVFLGSCATIPQDNTKNNSSPPVYIERDGKEISLSADTISTIDAGETLSTISILANVKSGEYFSTEQVDGEVEIDVKNDFAGTIKREIEFNKIKLGDNSSVQFDEQLTISNIDSIKIEDIFPVTGEMSPTSSIYSYRINTEKQVKSIILKNGKVRARIFGGEKGEFSITAGGARIVFTGGIDESNNPLGTDFSVSYDYDNDVTTVYVFEGKVSVTYKSFPCLISEKSVFGGQKITYKGCEDPGGAVGMDSDEAKGKKKSVPFNSEIASLFKVFTFDDTIFDSLTLNGIDLRDVNNSNGENEVLLLKLSSPKDATNVLHGKIKPEKIKEVKKVKLILIQKGILGVEYVEGMWKYIDINEVDEKNEWKKLDVEYNNPRYERQKNKKWLFGWFELDAKENRPKWIYGRFDNGTFISGEFKDKNSDYQDNIKKDGEILHEFPNLDNREYVMVIKSISEGGVTSSVVPPSIPSYFVGTPEPPWALIGDEGPSPLVGKPVETFPITQPTPEPIGRDNRLIAQDFISSLTDSIGRGDTVGLLSIIASDYSGIVGGYSSRGALMDGVRNFFLANDFLTITYTVGTVSSSGNEIIFRTNWTSVSNAVTKTGSTSWWITTEGTLTHAEGDWFF